MLLQPRKIVCNADLFICEPRMESFINNMKLNEKFTSFSTLNRIKSNIQNEFKSLPQNINISNCIVMVDSQQQMDLFCIIANAQSSNEIDIIKLKHALQNTRHIDIINDWLKGDKFVISSGMNVHHLQKHALNRFIKYEILSELSGMVVQQSYANNGQPMKLGNDIIDMISIYHDWAPQNGHISPMRISYDMSINYKYLFNITNASNVVKVNLKQQLQNDKIEPCSLLLDTGLGRIGRPYICILDNKLKLAAEQFQLVDEECEKVNTFQHAAYNINKPISRPQCIESDYCIVGYNIYMSCVINITEWEYKQIYACQDDQTQRHKMYQLINDKYKERIIRDPLYYDNLMVAYHVEVFTAQSHSTESLDNIMRITSNGKEYYIELRDMDVYHQRKQHMKDVIATNCRNLTGRLQNQKAQRDTLNLKIDRLKTIIETLQIVLDKTQPTNKKNNKIIQNATLQIKQHHKEMMQYQKQIKSSIEISRKLTQQFDACETIHAKMQFGVEPINVIHKLIPIKGERQIGLQDMEVSFIKRGRNFWSRKRILQRAKNVTFIDNKIEHMNIINMKSGNINGQSRYKLTGKYYEDKLSKISQAYRTKKIISYISSLKSQNRSIVGTISSQINQKGINFNYKYMDVIKTCTEHNRNELPPFNWQQEQTSDIMCKWLPYIQKILFIDRKQRKIWATNNKIDIKPGQGDQTCINDTIVQLFNSTLPYKIIDAKSTSAGKHQIGPKQRPQSQPHNFKQEYRLYKGDTYKLVIIVSRSILNNQMEQEELLHTSIVEFLDTKLICIVPNFKIEPFNWDLMGLSTTRNRNISDPTSFEMTLKRQITKILKEDIIYKHLCEKFINGSINSHRASKYTNKMFMINKRKRKSELISSNIMRLISKIYNANKNTCNSNGNLELSNLMFKISRDETAKSANKWRPIWQIRKLSQIESKCHIHALNNTESRYKDSISIYDMQKYLSTNNYDDVGDFNRFFDIHNAPYSWIIPQAKSEPPYLKNAEQLKLPDLEPL